MIMFPQAGKICLVRNIFRTMVNCVYAISIFYCFQCEEAQGLARGALDKEMIYLGANFVLLGF